MEFKSFSPSTDYVVANEFVLALAKAITSTGNTGGKWTVLLKDTDLRCAQTVQGGEVLMLRCVSRGRALETYFLVAGALDKHNLLAADSMIIS